MWVNWIFIDVDFTASLLMHDYVIYVKSSLRFMNIYGSVNKHLVLLCVNIVTVVCEM